MSRDEPETRRTGHLPNLAGGHGVTFLIWQVGTVVSECKLPIEVDEYVETFSPILVDLVHAW